MHKSVFTFGLLTSSLVMLSAMPLLNNNNSFLLNTAMAQGYDNTYGYDSYYSQYPTEDKKYECRTGPFEGFFVGSVEFCDAKHKFDDRKDHRDRDNSTGTQGPAGPAGSNEINLSNVYDRNGILAQVPPGPDVLVESVAKCDTGDIVIEGAFSIGGESATSRLDSFKSLSAGFLGLNQYRVSALGNDLFIQSGAICFNNP